MPILNLKITNPQAIDFINRLRSGELFLPFVNWLKKNRWYLASVLAIIVLIFALLVGKKLADSRSENLLLSPDIESPMPSVTQSPKSDFSGLKEEIEDFNSSLPDPYIPVFDNFINLEPTVTP